MKYDWLVFFSSFLFKLSSFCSAENFVLKLVFTCIFAFSFHCSAFSNVSRFNTRMEILKYLFSFCLPNSIIFSNFSASVGHFVAQQRSNRMSCFPIILTQQVDINNCRHNKPRELLINQRKYVIITLNPYSI